jgi:ketosteroid isomerase-like protein
VSQENVELVRRCYEAWDRRDFEALPELLQSDFELDLTARVLNPDRYVGVEGLRRFVDELGETWEDMGLEPEEFIDAGDQVVVPILARLRGRGSGLPLQDRIVQVWSVREGRVERMQVFTDRDEALRAAGLAP